MLRPVLVSVSWITQTKSAVFLFFTVTVTISITCVCLEKNKSNWKCLLPQFMKIKTTNQRVLWRKLFPDFTLFPDKAMMRYLSLIKWACLESSQIAYSVIWLCISHLGWRHFCSRNKMAPNLNTGQRPGSVRWERVIGHGAEQITSEYFGSTLPMWSVLICSENRSYLSKMYSLCERLQWHYPQLKSQLNITISSDGRGKWMMAPVLQTRMIKAKLGFKHVVVLQYLIWAD